MEYAKTCQATLTLLQTSKFVDVSIQHLGRPMRELVGLIHSAVNRMGNSHSPANSLYPDQVSPDLDPNCLTL